MADTRRLATSTAVFGVATAISRVAGLVREIAAAAVLGSGPVYSAFTVAFNLPNLVRAIVADNAISAAFVPVFLELREKGEEKEAWRVAGMVLWTTAVVLGATAAAAAPVPVTAAPATLAVVPTIVDAADARKATVITTPTAQTRNPWAVSRK
jgi:peptidoglycan biosynthesis protein MviN/MurJ (putative lipid II flippase)